jgi:GNAT superfamily N-acetyltransferase
MTVPAPYSIRRIEAAEASARADELAAVLLDCVYGGASVSFMADMTRGEALAFWAKVADGVGRGERLLFVAESEGRIRGTVQVVAAGLPNQPHRADIAKMLVRRDGRCRGIGAALLAAAEAAAHEAGFWLLVLDTVENGEGDRLYSRGGWRRVGLIPNFALWPDGRLCGTVYFYKDLRAQGPVTVAREPPDQPEVRAFLEASDASSAALYPAESNHMLDMAALLAPSVRFLVARRGREALGCGAVVLKEHQGELKRFFVTPQARGQRVGDALVAAAEAQARQAGAKVLRLETGIYSAAALALYRRNGFRPIEAFEPYAPDPLSVFMEKRL